MAKRMTEEQIEAAQIALAHQIEIGLGIRINSKKLGDFIRENWEQIAPLAHRVHGVDPELSEDNKPVPKQQELRQ